MTKLAAAPFVRQPGREYALRAEAKGEVLTLFVNGTPVLKASDSRYAYGMPGLGLTAAGETLWRALHISGECPPPHKKFRMSSDIRNCFT